MQAPNASITKKQKSLEQLPSLEGSSRSSISLSSTVNDLMLQRVDTCKQYIKSVNNHDLAAFRNLVTEDCRFIFANAEFNWKDFAGEFPKLFLAFPDFNLRCTSMEAQDDGTVKLCVFASGHHTGEAYSFGPFEPIPATGKYVQNDPEEIVISFQGDKMSMQKIYPQGDITGFGGIYTQLGGFPIL